MSKNTYQFKTTNIKGKQYVEVNERVKAFRTLSEYEGYGLVTSLLHLDENSVVVQATITDTEGNVVAQGMAQEDKSSSRINQTSFVENGETSAVGRALGFLGIGIDTSIATADEVDMAIAKQDNSPAPSRSQSTDSDWFSKAIDYIKSAKDKNQAYDMVVSKYGGNATEKQLGALKKFVG